MATCALCGKDHPAGAPCPAAGVNSPAVSTVPPPPSIAAPSPSAATPVPNAVPPPPSIAAPSPSAATPVPNAVPPPPSAASIAGDPTPPPSTNGPAPNVDAPAPSRYGPGSELGAYRLIELLGEGGMGFVYLAEHKRLGRRVALKLLRPEYAQNPSAVSRFFGEARAVNTICHENIVEITDFIEDQGDEKYYIMELLKGASLRDVLEQERSLQVGRAIGIAVQICSALDAVHNAGIVHRDLKPDNVFLITRGGRQDVVKILDFGVAKLGDVGEHSVHKTSAGAIIGTPDYMSPEQAAGTVVDYRTDIYALGVILFEMVTSAKPFTGKTFGEMVIKHMTVAPPRPSKLKELAQPIPRALEDLILACLEKTPEKRPQSMAVIGDKLRTLAADASLELEPFAKPHRRRGRGAIVGMAAVAVAAIAVAGFALLRPHAAPPPVVITKPAPVAKPALPAKVQISFSSDPAGATVYRKGSKVPLGRTPFALAVKRSDSNATFEIELTGHTPAEQVVSMRSDTRVQVSLAREVKHASRSHHAHVTHKHRKLDKSGVIDPFAEE